jgi:hypothetical protein
MEIVLTTMGFTNVLKELTRDPKCMATRRKFDKKHFIYMQEASTVPADKLRCQALKAYKLCQNINIASHIDMVSFDEPKSMDEAAEFYSQFTGNVTVGWRPTIEDILADDWVLISIKEEEE